MKVYGPKGEIYDGEPVDCRELMQVGGYTKEPQTVAQQVVALAGAASAAFEKLKDADKPAALEAELAALPDQVKSGAVKDANKIVASMKMRFGDLFTADNEASVRALFPPVYEDMSRKELQEELAARGIAYKADADKSTLVALLNKAGKRPDETAGKSAKVGE